MGSGNRTQGALEGGILEGFRVSGDRQWVGESGTWSLAIEDVEMRWIDAVPQTGRYVLETPFTKTATLNFMRLDEDTIEVTVSSGSRSFDFEVTNVRPAD